MGKGDVISAINDDAKEIISGGGFENDITFTLPDGSDSVAIKGITPVHHFQFDTEGRPVNSKSAHLTINESDLVAETYTTRVSGEVNLRGHFVEFKDATDVSRKYIIKENYHDEIIGHITCILGVYVNDPIPEGD